MKNLDKFYNRKEIPWVNLVWEKHYKNDKLPGIVKKGSFWWRDVLKRLPSFKEMATVQVKNGASCFFWKDRWISQPLERDVPPGTFFCQKQEYFSQEGLQSK